MKLKIIFGCTIILICLTSCKKYLDKKPDKRLAIPTSLADFQALLNNDNLTDFSAPQIGDLGCDDYYISNTNLLSQGPVVRNCYKWASDIWEGASASDWSDLYKNIYTCNVVLEGLANFKSTDANSQAIRDNTYGHALFVRALLHYFLEETFGQPYQLTTSSADLGIPLRINANLGDNVGRSSVSKVYDQIISDLEQAVDLVPAATSTVNIPTKAAVLGMLARVYLTIQDYNKAKEFAEKSLQANNFLLDYNTLDPNAGNSFGNYAPPSAQVFEVLYPAYQVSYAALYRSFSIIDSNLYRSYSDNDLRKKVLFRYVSSPSLPFFKGNYSGVITKLFSGPAVDEIYLIRAESNARLNNKDAALADLNSLLIKRWVNGTFTPIVATDSEDALRKVLIERRKELIFRGLRWIDLRRFNQDQRFATTLTRNLDGQIYTLPPNDKRYTYPIPNNEIQVTGIQQNPR